MARLRWLWSAPTSLLIHSQKGQLPGSPIAGLPSDHVLRRSSEGVFPFFRSICHLSSSLYGCDVEDVERNYGFLRTAADFNRGFHATGSRNLNERNYYEILGVTKDATRDDIKKAFHALAKKYHPDANKNNPTAKRKFQEIREAYETLRDPEKRAEYDKLKESFQGQDFRRSAAEYSTGYHNTYQDNFSDSFYQIFSEVFEDEGVVFAADIEVELNLSFSEAAKGCTKTVSFSGQVPCDSCYGRGHSVNAKPSTCPTCNGVGRVTVFPFMTTCSTCRGLGQIVQDYCLECKGSGAVNGVKYVSVTIPAGVDSGDKIHVPKAGNSGGKRVHAGNLIIQLQVAKDPIFLRDGADVYVDSRISFTQAILGGQIEVPTLSGTTEVKIPKGVQSGQLLVLRGRGLPKATGLVDHGDQYVRFHVHFPTQVNERQRAILEEFAKEEAMQENSGFFNANWWRRVLDHLSGPNIMLGVGILLLINLFLSKI